MFAMTEQLKQNNSPLNQLAKRAMRGLGIEENPLAQYSLQLAAWRINQGITDKSSPTRRRLTEGAEEILQSRQDRDDLTRIVRGAAQGDQEEECQSEEDYASQLAELSPEGIAEALGTEMAQWMSTNIPWIGPPPVED
jgi:hypothetical protein